MMMMESKSKEGLVLNTLPLGTPSAYANKHLEYIC